MKVGEKLMRRIAIAAALLALSLALGAQSASAGPPAHGGKQQTKKCKKGYVSKRGQCVKLAEPTIQSGTYGESSLLAEVDAAKRTVAFYFLAGNCNGAGVVSSGEPGSRVMGKLSSNKVGAKFTLSGSNTKPGYGFNETVTWEAEGRFASFHILKVNLHYTVNDVPTSPSTLAASCEATVPTETLWILP